MVRVLRTCGPIEEYCRSIQFANLPYALPLTRASRHGRRLVLMALPTDLEIMQRLALKFATEERLAQLARDVL